MPEPAQIVCDEDTPDHVKACNHLLGTCAVTIFGALFLLPIEGPAPSRRQSATTIMSVWWEK